MQTSTEHGMTECSCFPRFVGAECDMPTKACMLHKILHQVRRYCCSAAQTGNTGTQLFALRFPGSPGLNFCKHEMMVKKSQQYCQYIDNIVVIYQDKFENFIFVLLCSALPVEWENQRTEVSGWLQYNERSHRGKRETLAISCKQQSWSSVVAI